MVIFFKTTSKAQSMKEIIDKVDFLKITNLLCKRQCEENEWQAKHWQKIELILHIHSFCTLRFNQPWIFEKRKVQKISKSKTWICHKLATIYITFTLYLQLFTQFLHCIRLISNPRWFKVYREDMPWLHANTVLFYISDLHILVSWGKGGFWNQATAYVSGRTVFAKDTPDKGLSSKIHKELWKSNRENKQPD